MMPGTRRFFYCLFGFAVLVVIAGPVVAPRPEAAPVQVMQGWAVWQQRQCGACHGLLGQGGGFASDLTEFAVRTPLPEFDPNAAHSAMPLPASGVLLTDAESASLGALLFWVAKTDIAARWPPEPVKRPLAATRDTGR
nr:MAG: hypothetical protein DIU68_01055 [Chloroflexota bacterium]